MKKSYLFGIVLLISLNFEAQNYRDLIVRNNNDSVICRIDSVVNNQTFLTFKNNFRKTKTFLFNSDIKSIISDTNDPSLYIYKRGTSIIDHKKTSAELNSEFKNSLYLGLFVSPSIGIVIDQFSYERKILISKSNTYLTLSTGLILTIPVVMPEMFFIGSTLLMGKRTHFFEIGATTAFYHDFKPYIIPIIGYRYQSWSSGFTLKLQTANFLVPGISVGYAF